MEGLSGARAAVERDRELVTGRAGAADAAIFDAHLALLDDEALLEPARAAIAGGAIAERAVHDAAQQVAAVYRGLDEPLLQERATDVLDVGRRVVDAITGGASDGTSASASGIVVADELTPADAAGLDPERVLAIATARGSTTAHAAILARALGLPAVVGLGPDVLGVTDGTTLLLDGEAGTVMVDPPAEVVTDAQERRERAERRRAAARERALEPAVTRDGERIEVFANLGTGSDAAHAVALGAEGVGLLRTEFLFLGRQELPGEEEQAETLREIARALDGRPLIVRTLDAGADKPLPALPMPAEDNPVPGRARDPPGTGPSGGAVHAVARHPARRGRVPGQDDAADGGHAGRDHRRSRAAGGRAPGDRDRRPDGAGDHGGGPGGCPGLGAPGGPRRLLLPGHQRPHPVHDGRRARRRAAGPAAGRHAAGGAAPRGGDRRGRGGARPLGRGVRRAGRGPGRRRCCSPASGSPS